jgi:putative ABC transport system ATP-binding protein
MILLEGISKSYREDAAHRMVLRDLTLSIAGGEIVILLGKSGSGKSTLLNILSGIDLPDTGTVGIAGTDITRLTETERTLFRRHRIGFVFQSFNLIPTLTVRENLKLPLELNRAGQVEDRVDALLAEVGLAHRGSAFPDSLSGGEQQRVAIARALIHDPDLILADEPTGNLDYDTGRHIVDLLDAVVKQAGKTMIMVTHSRDVMGLADSVYALKEGKVHSVAKERAFE